MSDENRWRCGTCGCDVMDHGKPPPEPQPVEQCEARNHLVDRRCALVRGHEWRHSARWTEDGVPLRLSWRNDPEPQLGPVHEVQWNGAFRGTDEDPRETGWCVTCGRDVYDGDGVHQQRSTPAPRPACGNCDDHGTIPTAGGSKSCPECVPAPRPAVDVEAMRAQVDAREAGGNFSDVFATRKVRALLDVFDAAQAWMDARVDDRDSDERLIAALRKAAK